MLMPVTDGSSNWCAVCFCKFILSNPLIGAYLVSAWGLLFTCLSVQVCDWVASPDS